MEAIEVLAQPERPRAVDGNDFIDCVAEQEGAIQGRHPRIRKRDVLAVQIADGQRHAGSLREPQANCVDQPAPPAALRDGGERMNRNRRQGLGSGGHVEHPDVGVTRQRRDQPAAAGRPRS